MAIRLADLAVRYGCELKGDPDVNIDHVATLQAADSGAISFLANPGYRRYLATTKATAVVLHAKDADEAPSNCLVTDNPYAVYARVAQELHPTAAVRPGIHTTAVIGDGCKIPKSCEIAPGAVLGNGVCLGEHVYIGPNCTIGDNVSIGDATRLYPNVVCYHDIVIGKRCLIHSTCVLGADGFGIAKSQSGWVKVPQVGRVVIGDDVEIGANTTIDRGAIDDTQIGNGVKFDNGIQIGHNVVVGEHTAIAAQSGIAGSTTIGKRCMIGGVVSIAGHISIADDVILLGRSAVTATIKDAGTYSSIIPIEEAGKWRRIAARIRHIDDLAKRLIRIEKQVKK